MIASIQLMRLQMLTAYTLQDDPPLRTVIGSDAYTAIMGKLKTYGVFPHGRRIDKANANESIGELYPKYEKLANSTDAEGYKRPS